MNGMSDPTPLIVVVLVDALGWEPVSEAAFLASVLPHRRPLETVLGFSAGAIPALLSGTSPSTETSSCEIASSSASISEKYGPWQARRRLSCSASPPVLHRGCSSR